MYNINFDVKEMREIVKLCIFRLDTIKNMPEVDELKLLNEEIETIERIVSKLEEANKAE